MATRHALRSVARPEAGHVARKCSGSRPAEEQRGTSTALHAVRASARVATCWAPRRARCSSAHAWGWERSR